MEQHHDQWRQIRLSNVLLSVALFGMALGLWKLTGNFIRDEEQYNVSFATCFAVWCGHLLLLAGAIGALIGRLWLGFLSGAILVGGMVLLLAVVANY